MATTVNAAFSDFMENIVNLNCNDTKKALISRDNLIDNLTCFSKDYDFFKIYSDKNLKYGSFARKTKIKPLDDIDLMICLSADYRKYIDKDNHFYVTVNEADKKNKLYHYNNTYYLNSTKVINRFITKLSNLNDYIKAEMHKNQEAVTLKLKSYAWNFDIIPCFYTTSSFYLIPDGDGNWKKTDPRIDNNRTTNINQKFNGNLLNLIRLVKYWNNRKIVKKIGSYLLECMILNRYEYMSGIESSSWWIDIEFRDTLFYLASEILDNVYDPKGIQGNLNEFDNEDRRNISSALLCAYYKANEATNYERNDKNQRAAINKWREILGNDFPTYTGRNEY